jgi:hypothetical protein
LEQIRAQRVVEQEAAYETAREEREERLRAQEARLEQIRAQWAEQEAVYEAAREAREELWDQQARRAAIQRQRRPDDEVIRNYREWGID